MSPAEKIMHRFEKIGKDVIKEESSQSKDVSFDRLDFDGVSG